jgi:hypothetical protein
MIAKAGNLTRRSTFLVLVFSCSVSFAAGQIAGGLTETTNTRLGGNNYIVGTVFSPGGSPLNRRMRIRLSTPTWGEVLATTDDNGRFVFSGVASGVYTIIIDGEKEFEMVRQEVEITRRRSTVPETYTMTIRLRAIERKTEKPSVISELETYLKLVPTAPDAAHLRQVIEHSKRSLGSTQPEKWP